MTSTIPPSPTANAPLQSTPPRWTVHRILGTSALLLLGALAWQWLWPGAQAHWVPPQPQTMQMAALLAPLPDLDASSLANRWPQRQNELLMLQERPLFVMGRKPPPPPPPAVPDNVPAPSDQWNTAKVLGTFASGTVKGAFVELESQPQRMLQGQVLHGWKLVDVQPQSIELLHGTQKRQLQVQKKDLTQLGAGGNPAAVPSGARPAASNPSPFAIRVPAPAAASPTPEPAASAPAPTPAPAPKKRPVFGGSRSSS